MELVVNNVKQSLKFGVGFLYRLDEIYQAENQGMKFGAGLQLAYPSLLLLSVPALANIVKCALPNTFSQAQVERAIEDYAEENDGLESLFDEVVEGLKTSKVTKDTLEKMLKQTPGVKEETPEV